MHIEYMSEQEERALQEMLEEDARVRAEHISELVNLASLRASLSIADRIYVELKDGSKISIPSAFRDQVLDCARAHIAIAQDGLIEVLKK